MTAALKDQLQHMLEGTVTASVESQRTRFAKAAWPARDGIVLCGSGYLGKKVLEGLRKVGVEPLAFCDNNPSLWSGQVNGLRVLSPADAAARYGSAALFVITIYTAGPLLRQMQSLGVPAVSFPEFAWVHPEALLPHAALDLPYKIFEMANPVREGLGLWEDEASRREYVGQLLWRTSLDPTVLPPHLPPGQIYFPDDLLSFRSDEVFVDCGAFDGDSIRAFIDRRESVFEAIIGIEADLANCHRLENYLSTLAAATRARVSTRQVAVGSESKTIRFNATGSPGSSVGEGSAEVRCEPLDEILAERTPTYIKMDIEGAEQDAIVGARKTIETHAPVLAICLYHRMEDLWQIPMLIKSFQPRYRLFLRRYADDCWEQVCYAIPEDRLK